MKRPRVSAATAGPKTSPTIAVSVFAASTGQKLGAAKITTAPHARTARATTRAPRFAGVASIAAPAGVWAAKPTRPETAVTTPTDDWLQPCWVTKKTLR